MRSRENSSEFKSSVKESQMTQAIELRKNNNMLICETPMIESVENGIDEHSDPRKFSFKR